MNNFIKKLIGFSIGPVAGAFITFLTIPLTTYFIDPNEYGKASMFSLFQMIFGTFLFLGIDQAYTREYHSSKNKLNLFQNAIFIPLIMAFFILLITFLLPSQISILLFGSSNLIIPAILFGIMIVAMVIERFILLSLRMEEKALEYSLVTIFTKLAIFFFTLVFVIFIRRDFLAVVYSAVFGQIIADIYLIIRYRLLFVYKNFSLNKELLKKMLLFGLPILIATSLSSLLNSLDRLSLRAWSDFYQVGIFTATLKIAGALSIIQVSFTSFWVPTAYRWYEEGKNIEYFKIVSDSILLLMSILFIAILMLKDLIIYVLSPGYADATYIVAFLCLQPIIYTVSETTCLGIVFSKKTYLSIWVGLIALVPNIIINIILVPKFGAIGAAIATSVSYVFFFVARTHFSNENGMRFPVIKHYGIILLLLSGAFLNLLSIKWMFMFMINISLLFLILSLQFTTIKKMWTIYRKKDTKESGFFAK
ncbi:oligosaccharide flippase family protein [Peribacillus frigoritolerans]|uniref:oligosaccharide flippase family protein n=1 Tax=Peribacillus frigoritolerans TaxID=450367 RepID=UPI0033058883